MKINKKINKKESRVNPIRFVLAIVGLGLYHLILVMYSATRHGSIEEIFLRLGIAVVLTAFIMAVSKNK